MSSIHLFQVMKEKNDITSSMPLKINHDNSVRFVAPQQHLQGIILVTAVPRCSSTPPPSPSPPPEELITNYVRSLVQMVQSDGPRSLNLTSDKHL